MPAVSDVPAPSWANSSTPAHYAGQHTILTKNDEPRAVLVPYEWWREQQNRPG